jgi:DNA uptake protein ComE-like DNA-binding protein
LCGWMMASSQLNPPTRDPANSNRRMVPGQRRLDVNRADVKELSGLPGMTKTAAERIVGNRPYKKLDDLVSRKILGKKQFALIKEFITAGGPTGP